MKNIMFRVFAIITLLVTVAFASALVTVSAQTSGQNITAIVPFDVTEGRQLLNSRGPKTIEQNLATNNTKAVTVAGQKH